MRISYRYRAIVLAAMLCAASFHAGCRGSSDHAKPARPAPMAGPNPSEGGAVSAVPTVPGKCPEFRVSLPKEKLDAAMIVYVFVAGQKLPFGNSRVTTEREGGTLSIAMKSCNSLPADTYYPSLIQLIYALEDGRVTEDETFLADTTRGFFKLDGIVTDNKVPTFSLDRNDASLVDKLDSRYHRPAARLLSRGCELNRDDGFKGCSPGEGASSEILDTFVHDVESLMLAGYNDPALRTSDGTDERLIASMRKLQSELAGHPAFVALKGATEARMNDIGQKLGLQVGKVVDIRYTDAGHALDETEKTMSAHPDFAAKLKAKGFERILFYTNTILVPAHKFIYISVGDDAEKIYSAL